MIVAVQRQVPGGLDDSALDVARREARERLLGCVRLQQIARKHEREPGTIADSPCRRALHEGVPIKPASIVIEGCGDVAKRSQAAVELQPAVAIGSVQA